MSLTFFEVGQSNTPVIFSSSILILSDPITTPKYPTSITFHLYSSGFIQVVFYQPLHYFLYHFIVFFLFFCSHSYIINEACYFSIIGQVPQDLVYHCLECCWRISLKNITGGSNNPCGIINTIFHSLLFFIHTLLYLHHKSNLVNTFLVPIFSIISEIMPYLVRDNYF